MQIGGNRFRGWMTGLCMAALPLVTGSESLMQGVFSRNPAAVEVNAQVLQASSRQTVASPTPRPTASNGFEQELLQLTNLERSRAGLRPLRLSSQLGQAAQRHAADMVANQFFSHTGSDGSSLVDRARAVGYRYSFVGENIAAGGATPAATMRQWMNSPGHRQNILNRNFTEIGFGYVSAPNDRYRHYWVQVFGTPMRSR